MCQELLKNYLGANQTCKLQIGSGPNALEGWLNTDINPTNENVLKLDATGTLPFDDCTFDYVFSEHLMDIFVINNFFRDWGNKFIYDYKTLRDVLEKCGFINITRYNPGESDDKNLQGIE